VQVALLQVTRTSESHHPFFSQVETVKAADEKSSKRQKIVVNAVTPFDISLHPCMDTSNPFKSLEALTSSSDLKAIREKGLYLYYVDKTKLVLDLVKEERSYHVFLSRPRRFGRLTHIVQ
jgi:hypothetical protein